MSPTPSTIKLHRRSQELELVFGRQRFLLPAEFLRVLSPSAEVKGHGPGQEVLQLNKAKVAITGVEAQGNYAIKLIFSDRHDSGIYTWDYLYELGTHQHQYWQDYLTQVTRHKEMDDVSAVKWVDPR
ncbi:MAG: DUF971 family protein [Lentisphaeria bacterium]|jgi:DUF971 family protein